jgi:arylsulfatase A-like enzyme
VVAGPQYRAMYSNYDEGAQHYYGCITALDEQVGRLRSELRALKAAGNTMLWFTSDNGPEGKSSETGTTRGVTGGLRGRKRSLFSGGVNVPGLLEWPGRAQPGRVVDLPCSTLDYGRVVDLPCSTLDYFPTVQELAGYEMPGMGRPLDGINLLPLIDGRAGSRPTPICFRYVQPKDQMFDAPMLAIVEGRYKFLTNLGEDAREDLLFDLVADRGESTNIISRHADLARSLKARLRDWIEGCRRSHNGADYDDPAYKPWGEFEPLAPTWPGGKGAEGD